MESGDQSEESVVLDVLDLHLGFRIWKGLESPLALECKTSSFS